LDIQTEIKWIQTALNESKDATFISAVKNRIVSMRKVKEAASKERLPEDKLMLEAEEDIKEGRTYSIDEAHEIIRNWKM